MSVEEDIKQKLLSRFGLDGDSARIQRVRRISAQIDYPRFRQALEYAVRELDFPMLCTITGLDEGENFSFIYHLGREDGVILNLKTGIPKGDPRLKTITDFFPNAEIYEREIADLLGVKVEGLPPGHRYPLTDDWPAGEYPLRKDWKMKEEGTQNG